MPRKQQTKTAVPAPPAIDVLEYRVSFLWFDIDVDLMRCDTPHEPYLSRYADKIAYRRLMAELLSVPPSAYSDDGLSLPWTNFTRDRFWKCYLSPEDALNARLLSRQLVPVFVKTHSRLDSAASPDFFVSHQAFTYPFGTAVATHVEVRRATDLPGLVEVVHSLLGMPVERSCEHGARSTMSLGAAGRALLSETRSALVGRPSTITAERTVDPVTIVTITAVDGQDAGMQPVDNDLVHRTIWALTRRDTNWRVERLKSIAACNRKTRALSDRCLIFQGPGGNQAIWCPDMLEPFGSPSKSLVCYHHNLVSNTVQFGSLIRFLDRCSRILADDTMAQYREFLTFCAERALDIVRRACDPWDENTYHSGSTAALLKCNPPLERRIASVRKHLGRTTSE